MFGADEWRLLLQANTTPDITMSSQSKISAAEKEICFGFIQSHLATGSSKSITLSETELSPVASDESLRKKKGEITAIETDSSICSDSDSVHTPEQVSPRLITDTGTRSFVRLGKCTEDQDPFIARTPSDEFGGSPSNRGVRRRASREHTKKLASCRSTPSANDKIMKNWRVTEPIPDDRSPTNSKRARADPHVCVPDTVIIDKNNCQLYYSPDSCLFVANLNSQHDEVELEAAVTEIFRKYGTVYVKITRDKKNMPMGFVQFTNSSDAARARDKAKGTVIFGRGCRIEWSNANRNYHLTRHDGIDVTEAMARAVLEKFGDLERIHFPTETEIVIFNLGRGPLVTFVNYQSGREALNELRDSDEWNFQAKVNERNASPFQSGKSPVSRASFTGKVSVDNLEVDQRSIFVANLPANATESQVHDLFDNMGHIVNITINRRPSVREGCDVNVFAYVEFANPRSVQDSIEAMNMYSYGGSRLKVDQKKPQDLIACARRKPLSQGIAHDGNSATVATPSYYGSPYQYMGYPPTPYTGSTYPGYAHYPYHMASYCYPGSPGYVATPVSDSGNGHGHITTGPPPVFAIPAPYGQVDYYGQNQVLPYAVQYGPQAHIFQHTATGDGTDGNVFNTPSTSGEATESYQSAQ
ncbi:hypothetical protein V492_07286 [Pseudogymnoascus sp. VKM F-4246]|nr:hypothetical protein V492_07286 [Pseudogymnoascus sp. VKM F-4246]